VDSRDTLYVLSLVTPPTPRGLPPKLSFVVISVLEGGTAGLALQRSVRCVLVSLPTITDTMKMRFFHGASFHRFSRERRSEKTHFYMRIRKRSRLYGPHLQFARLRFISELSQRLQRRTHVYRRLHRSVFSRLSLSRRGTRRTHICVLTGPYYYDLFIDSAAKDAVHVYVFTQTSVHYLSRELGCA
jgi:hypothetical protein